MAKAKRKSRATWLTIDLPSNGINYELFGGGGNFYAGLRERVIEALILTQRASQTL